MKTIALTILCSCVFLAGIESCTPPKGNQITSGGGKGGNTTLFLIPEHHGALLDSCMIYIKYGTLDAPGNGSYDDSMKCSLQVPPADTTPAVAFTGLTNGIYYLFAQGYHPGYGNVKGGVNWTISTQNTTDTIHLQTSTF